MAINLRIKKNIGLELFGAKKQLCAKWYPNHIPNDREKCEQTDKHTHSNTKTYSYLYK